MKKCQTNEEFRMKLTALKNSHFGPKVLNVVISFVYQNF